MNYNFHSFVPKNCILNVSSDKKLDFDPLEKLLQNGCHVENSLKWMDIENVKTELNRIPNSKYGQ